VQSPDSFQLVALISSAAAAAGRWIATHQAMPKHQHIKNSIACSDKGMINAPNGDYAGVL
jgi:hypothetical protein